MTKYSQAWLVGALLLLIGGVLLFAIRREPRPPPVLLLNRPWSPPILLRDRLGPWIPRSSSWRWAHRFEDAIFGPRKPLKFNQQIFALTQDPDRAETQLGLAAPAFSHRQTLAVWFLRPSELKAVRAHLQPMIGHEGVYGTRVSTAEGIGASIFSGETVLLNGLTNQVGLEASYFGRVRKQGTDVFASVQFSELQTNNLSTELGQKTNIVARTNLNVAARMQVPIGCGVFLLSGGSSTNCMGILIEPP